MNHIQNYLKSKPTALTYITICCVFLVSLSKPCLGAAGVKDSGSAINYISGIVLSELPIKIQFRPSVLGIGYVVSLTNASDKTHVINVVHERYKRPASMFFEPDYIKLREATLKLESGQTAELGWVEGWRINKNDYITLSESWYSIKSFRIASS